MATKPRTNRSPYMMSANLGSGARTTTGGTYENPRLGIQDYTAFGRGVASTLKAPTPEEEAELKLTDIGAWDPDVNEHYIDENGVAHDLNDDAFTLANARWLNNFVEAQKQKFRTSNKRGQAAIQSDMNQYKDLNNMGLTLEAAADKTTDASIRVFLPGVNGEKTSVSLASLARITNENPNALEVTSRNNKAGIPQKGYILNTGSEKIFINASAMNASWRQDNFAIKYNEDATLNDALKVRGSGYTTQFQKVGTTYFDEQNDKNYQVGVSDKYVQNESISRYTRDANLHANEYFSPGSFTDETFASAWNQLRNIVGNGNFAFSDQLQAKVEQAGGINGQGMNNALRTELLRDYTAERYKLKNGDAFIVSEGNDAFAVGRAIPKTYTNAKYWDADYKKSEQKPRVDTQGGGGVFGNAASFVADVLGPIEEIAFVGAGGKVSYNINAPQVTYSYDSFGNLKSEVIERPKTVDTGTPKGVLKQSYDLQKATDLLNRVRTGKEGDGYYLNLNDNDAVNTFIKNSKFETKSEFIEFLQNKNANVKTPLIAFVNTKGDDRVTNSVDFDGTIGSFSGAYSRAAGLSSTQRSQFNTGLNKLLEFGDINKYYDWTGARDPNARISLNPGNQEQLPTF